MRGLVVAGLALAAAGGLLLAPRLLLGRLVFQPERGEWRGLAELGLEGEEVWLSAADGVRLHAYFLPAPGATRAILFLHGNAGNASHRLPNAAALARLGAHVLLPDYRGYGRSEGRPTEAGVYADARAALAHLVEARGLPESRIVLFGRSLGAAVAVDLARDRGLAGVVLESPFSSASDLANALLRLPIGGLLRGRWDSAAKISSVRAPLLFFHGDRDRVVPIEVGLRLYRAAPARKALEVLRGAGHNDTVAVGGARYFARIRAFLDEVAPGAE